MYLADLQKLLSGVHPAIASLRIELVAGNRDALAVVVDTVPDQADSVLVALRRSEASFRPRGIVFEYRLARDGTNALPPARDLNA